MSAEAECYGFPSLYDCAIVHCCVAVGLVATALLVKLPLDRVKGLLDLDFNTKMLQRCHLIRYGRLLSGRKN